MTVATIELPPKLVPLFTQPRGSLRYRCAKGGRGSGKSFSFALMAAIWGYAEPLRILCTRELQVSIKESMFAELKNAIESIPWLSDHYEVGESFIRGKNGTEFLFRGLRHNISAIKSMAQIDLCIVEEAEDVPEASWRDLLPTVRAVKSEIWVVWNPRLDGSPVDQRFVKKAPQDAMLVQMNYSDNPWFPVVLDAQRKHDQRTMDMATYAHIWEGAYLQNSDAQVLAGKVRVDEFTPAPDWDGPYLGADWGFAQDATTAIKCWVHDDRLYIEYEAYKVGLEIDQTADYLKKCIPQVADYTLRADSARPETISYLKRHGLPKVDGVKKWPGSVQDGVAHLRSYAEIVVHPRCKETIQETRLYSYKVDRLSGDILPEIVDAHNHCLIAGTMIETLDGPKPIESVTNNDLVLTRGGYRAVLFAGVTDTNRDVVQVKTTVGTFVCTPDHKVFTENKGFIRADALRYNDVVLSFEKDASCQRSLNTTARFTDATQKVNAGQTACTLRDRLQAAPFGCIVKSGKMPMAQYLKGITSTIRTKTRLITRFQILSVFQSSNICKITSGQSIEDLCTSHTSIESGRLLKPGIQAQREGKLTGKLAKWLTKGLLPLIKIVSIAKLLSKPKSSGTKINFAPIAANHPAAAHLGWITSSDAALSAQKHSLSISTATPNVAQGRVLSVTDSGKADFVYDITVDKNHEFFANGVLVHNCIDAARYALAPLIKVPKPDIVMDFL